MLEIQSSKIVLTLVDTETGELFTKEAAFGDFKEVTKKATTTRTRKAKTDDEPTPMIHLLEGKWQLNTKAVELTGFEPEMKLDIKFEKKGRTTTPVLCEDEKSGNRLTKTFTVSCRGSKHDNLAEYGDIFDKMFHRRFLEISCKDTNKKRDDQTKLHTPSMKTMF